VYAEDLPSESILFLNVQKIRARESLLSTAIPESFEQFPITNFFFFVIFCGLDKVDVGFSRFF
jgi:hypothetical protein